MSNSWQVRDLIERISKQNEQVCLWVAWCKRFISVDRSVALDILEKYPPDERIDARFELGKFYLG
jgi:hypothetical protein